MLYKEKKRRFPVRAGKEDLLAAKMKELGIHEEEIQEKFIRSSGAGGQHINKVATSVFLRHLPTGIEVKCGKARTQGLNRYFARKILLEKIEEKILKKASAALQEREKIRRQKRKRSKRSQKKLLEIKRIHGRKKELRKEVVDLE